METIFSKIKGKGRQILLLSVLILFAAVAEMMLPSLLTQMINSGVADSSRNTILILAAVMAGVTAFACIINFLSLGIASRISTDFSAELRRQIFEKVQSFSAAELDRFGTASLVTRSTSDITNVQNFLTMLLRIGILAPMMAVAGLVFSAATGGQVSSVLCVSIPVLLIGCGIVILFASRYSVKLRQKLDKINQLFLESLEGVRVIRAFNKQKAESRRFGEANIDYAATAMTSGRITSLFDAGDQYHFRCDHGSCFRTRRTLCRKGHYGSGGVSGKQPIYQHGADVGYDAGSGHYDVSHGLCLF